MKNLLFVFVFLAYITNVNAIAILCNDEKLVCHVFVTNCGDGDCDACCYDFIINPGSGWDCTHGIECQTFQDGNDSSDTRSSNNDGLQIIDGKIYSDGELIATMKNPTKAEDVTFFTFKKPFDIGSFDFSEDITLDNGSIFIGDKMINGLEVDKNHRPIDAILTITKKEKTESISDIYFHDNPSTPNELSFILPKDIISIHILDENLNIVKSYETNQDRMLEKIDYSGIDSGKYYITFISKQGKYSKQIIKI